MSDQLLTIKLYPPPLRPGLVERQRLLDKLNQGFDGWTPPQPGIRAGGVWKDNPGQQLAARIHYTIGMAFSGRRR